MSFKVITPGTFASLLSDGRTYRVSCVRCGLFRETTDRHQASAEADIHNSPGNNCQPPSMRSALY